MQILPPFWSGMVMYWPFYPYPEMPAPPHGPGGLADPCARTRLFMGHPVSLSLGRSRLE